MSSVITCTHLCLIWIVDPNPSLEESVDIAVMHPKQWIVWSSNGFTKWFTKYSVYLKQVERCYPRSLFLKIYPQILVDTPIQDRLQICK